MNEGITTSGMASSGMELPEPIWPAAFFLEGAEERTTLPSYKCDVSPDGLLTVITVHLRILVPLQGRWTGACRAPNP